LRDEVEAEVIVDGLLVDGRSEPRRSEQRRHRVDLRREGDATAWELRVVQRLLPERVAREDQGAALEVHHRDSEHPPELGRERVAVILVGMDDRLHVGT
jgi:hypothetical protein